MTREHILNELRRNLARFIDDEGVVADLPVDILNFVSEQCALIARGHADGDGFVKHGTRQLYWKGRSDAALEIRLLQVDTTLVQL